MVAMRATWDELQDTPYDVVQRLGIYLMVTNAHENGKSISFDGDDATIQ